MVIISELSKKELWEPTECQFCFLENFLDDRGRIPWLVGLRLLHEHTAFYRSISYLQSQGEAAEPIKKWVDETVSKAWAEAIKERGTRERLYMMQAYGDNNDMMDTGT